MSNRSRPEYLGIVEMMIEDDGTPGKVERVE